MYKKYIVRLSDAERQVCHDVVKKLKGSLQKVRRAQILLKSDADGPGWTDANIAEAYHCRVQTIENLRKRLVMHTIPNPIPGDGSGARRSIVEQAKRDYIARHRL